MDRPRGQAERGIKRERTLRTSADLVYKDPLRRSKRKGGEGEKREETIKGRMIVGGQGEGGKDAHV